MPSDETSLSKVAEVTLVFWVMKICATTLGETAGDLLSMTLDVGYARSSLLLLAFFAVTLCAQLALRSYQPLVYWLVVVSTSTAGTTMSDFMDRTLELGYARGSLLLAALLVCVLAFWKLTQKTLSVEHIATRSAEGLYWAGILVSNTLGTALGDYLADDSGLGFLGGAAVIGGALLVLVVLRSTTKLDRAGLFWAAFVLTRPFGATFGDLLTKPAEKGGLSFGTMGSSAVLGATLAVLVVWQQLVARRRSAA